MAAETQAEPRNNPSMSTLAFFGTELRIRREEAGLTQQQVADGSLCSRTLLAHIEQARRVPSEEFAARADAVLETGGFFARLWPLVMEYAYPKWFRRFVDLEKDATEIWNFENQVVPGLLQTEDYAQALFAAARVANTDDLVAARLTRQQLLEKDKRPRLWTALDENVLRRPVGSRVVMRRQLERLVEATEDRRIIVQVIPYNVGAHASMDGPFAGLALAEGPGIVYVDGRARGQILADEASVEEYRYTYDLLRADALSPRASIDLISAVAKELS
ncbi:helix-turn-helix domain-containing protein [Streptomyces sp. MUM 203J]|uniref:helix-turn-helix domain-containing protein n=1 Tax=Streptomyces sp. MUM 203J TaxID=2791990 RepID=UPI001F040EE5|nr:helix-turn-helix transcriptional regulator [Streptomyces sp. MUM 203J]MCH0539001.1 helix-turn-helix domain-containing protein [Streptomyces sp. MUM 203J]